MGNELSGKKFVCKREILSAKTTENTNKDLFFKKKTLVIFGCRDSQRSICAGWMKALRNVSVIFIGE